MGKGRLVIGVVLELEKKKKNLCVVTTSSSVKQNVEKEQRRRARWYLGKLDAQRKKESKRKGEY